MIFLKTRPEVKVTVTCKWYKTLNHPKLHSHTKFGIPFSNNIRDLLLTQLLLKLGQRSRSQWPENNIWDSTIPRCIYTPIGIPTSKNIRDMLQTQKFLKLGQRSRSQWPKMVCVTLLSSQDAFRHQIWNSYLKEYRRYAPDTMQFLEIRSEVKFKVTVTQL